jgi:hypothetical protein
VVWKRDSVRLQFPAQWFSLRCVSHWGFSIVWIHCDPIVLSSLDGKKLLMITSVAESINFSRWVCFFRRCRLWCKGVSVEFTDGSASPCRFTLCRSLLHCSSCCCPGVSAFLPFDVFGQMVVVKQGRLMLAWWPRIVLGVAIRSLTQDTPKKKRRTLSLIAWKTPSFDIYYEYWNQYNIKISSEIEILILKLLWLLWIRLLFYLLVNRIWSPLLAIFTFCH